MQFKKLWLTSILLTVLSVALAMLGQAQAGSAPEILFIDFPSEIRADGNPVSGLIGFKDPDGDLFRADFVVVEAKDFQPFSVMPDVKGKTEGAFAFQIATRTAQRVTLRVTLTDEAGNKSAPKDFSFTAVAVAPPPALRVPQDFSTIQAAINAAQAGNTIIVSAGTYNESITITKSLTLRGAGRRTTIVNGGDPGRPVIRIESAQEIIEVRIENLTVTGAVEVPGSICAETGLKRICPQGIQLWGKVKGVITNNEIVHNIAGGIEVLNGANATITDNTISGDGKEGIGIQLFKNATAIIRNNILHRSEGIGILVYVESKAEIVNNTITSTSTSARLGDGIEVLDASEAQIKQNTITENGRYGIFIGGGHHFQDPNRKFRSSSAVIEDNTISGNGSDGILVVNGEGARTSASIARNTIRNNRGCGVRAVDNPGISGTGNTISNNTGGNLCPPVGTFNWPPGFGGGA